MKRFILSLICIVFVLVACKGNDVTLRAVFINGDGDGVTTISLDSEEEAVIRYEVTNTSNQKVEVTALRGEIAPISNTSVLYIAPQTTEATKDAVTVRSLADTSELINLVVNVAAGTNNNDVAVNITPATITTSSGEEIAFNADVTGLEEDDTRGVTWSSDDLTPIRETDSNVVIVAPDEEGTYIVRATSRENSNRFDEARLIVENTIDVTVTPATVTLQEEEQQVFTAEVTGTDDSRVTWSVDGGDDNGSLNIQGLSAIYTAPNADGTYILTVRSLADSDQSAQSVITVTDDGISDVEVIVTPTVVNLGTRESTVFNAQVTGTDNTAVTWKATDGGLIIDGNTATYTAPDNAGTYTITATSNADPDIESSVNITVSDVAVSVDPATATLKPDEEVAITASVTGANNTDVAWQGDNISINGNTAIYTAPTAEGTYIITAVSNADNRRTAQTIITVEEDVKVRLEPDTLELGVGETRRIRAIVTGDSNTDVTWNTNGGTITGTSNTVDYRAPANAGSYTITATSEADTSQNATAVATVEDINIQISPSSVTLNQGETQSFRATVSGAYNKEITWSANDGTIDVDGNQVVYTAPAREGNYLLTATSNANTSIETSVTITVRE